MANNNSTKLTAQAARDLKSGFLAADRNNPGLRLVVNADKSKTWIYRFKFEGKLKQRKIGNYPEIMLPEAKEKHFLLKQARDNDKNPQTVTLPGESAESSTRGSAKEEVDRVSQSATVTLRHMIDSYLDRAAKKRNAKSHAEVVRLLNHDIGELADMAPEEIEAPDVHQHVVNIGKRSPSAARNFRRELKAAWNRAILIGMTKVPNPFVDGLGDVEPAKKRTRTFSSKELSQLMPWIRDNLTCTVSDALFLTLFTGMRSGEVVGLHDREILEESDGLWIEIPGERMKMGKTHRVPLFGTALEIVERRRASGYLFPATNASATKPHVQQKTLGVELYAHSGRSSAKRYANNVVMPVADVTAHDFRRTARTRLAALYCPDVVGEAILAHAIPGVMGIYNQHDYDSEKREWLERLGAHLDGIIWGAE